jgi:hypothetical protein
MVKKQSLGPPIDINRVLGKTRNRVHRCGVELEGGWDRVAAGMHIARDGSVVFTDEFIREAHLRAIGELASPPLAVVEKDAVSALHYPVWMKVSYPSHVNATCGMHVHMSFASAFTYERLMVPSFSATIIEYINRWAKDEKLPDDSPIWPRLAGKNEYCQHKFFADEQVTKANKDYDHYREGNRYCVIGYPWTRLQTVECRLLPMFPTWEQAVEAVHEVIAITNAFLVVTAKREEKVKGSCQVDEEKLVEEKRLFV